MEDFWVGEEGVVFFVLVLVIFREMDMSFEEVVFSFRVFFVK